MLSLAFPIALGFLAALAAVAFFYFLRMRFRRQPVSSNLIWNRLVKNNDGGARLQWKSLLLLLLQLTAVTVLVFALAGLQWVHNLSDKPGTVYVLDASASMEAKEGIPGVSRWDRAKRSLAADAAGLDPDAPVAVFVGKDLVRQGRAAEAASWLGALNPTGDAFLEAPVAEVLTAWLQTQSGAWSGVILTDGGLDLGGTRLEQAFGGRLRSLFPADQAPNLGLEDVRVASPGLRLTLFNGFADAKTVQLVFQKDGKDLGRQNTSLAPGLSQASFSLTDSGPGTYRVQLEGNTDSLTADDEFTVIVNPVQPLHVLFTGSPNPFLRSAFPGAATTEPYDLTVVEGNALPKGFSGNLVTFGALPPGAPVSWGPEVTGAVTAAPQDDELGRWVPWDDLQVQGGRSLVVQPGVSVLAEVDGKPVAAAWDQDGFRVLALGVNVFHSNLGLSSALPVLMRNFRQEILPQEGNPLVDNLRVGRAVLRAGSAGWKVTSTTSRSGVSALHAVRRGGLWELTAQDSGTFTWSDGSQTGQLAATIPPEESDTSPRALRIAERTSLDPPAQAARSEAVSLAPLLLVVVILLWGGEWWLWFGRLGKKAPVTLMTLRLASLVCLVLAVAGISALLPTLKQNLVLSFDASGSLGSELVEQERASALRLVAGLQPDDKVAVVAFAGRPLVVSGLQPRDVALRNLKSANLASGEKLRTDATDIQAALAAGSQLLGSENGTSVQYLFSDGRANQGGALSDLSGAALRFAVSPVPLGRPLAGVAGRSLDLPASARPGEPLLAKWEAWADQAQTVRLDLVVDGKTVTSRSAALTPGLNTFSFPIDAGNPGARRVELRVYDDQGTPIPSAQAAALLQVEGKAQVLVVRDAGGPGPLDAALATQGLDVRSGGSDALPEDSAGYQGTSAVVLDNVPALALTEAQQSKLQDYVAGGGGLLVVGGDESLGRGEYYSTGLEDLLPVKTDTRQRIQFTRSRILFVVDHSGSMGDQVGDLTKLQVSLGGIASSLDEMTAQDEVGILEFDSQADWILPFTSIQQKQTILDSLGTFKEGGGTDMTTAVNEVEKAFGHPGPVRRHVILLTDGQTGGSSQFFLDFAARMKDAEVTVTTIGIGNEVNEELLGSMAKKSGGLYYHAVGADIPRILNKETVRVTRDLIQEGRFIPQIVGRDPVQEVGGALPPVLGYLITKAKPQAKVLWDMQGQTRDPLYAVWRYGSGQVAVFTSDSGARWLGPWSGRPVFNRFWGQVVRSLVRSGLDKNLGLEVSVQASTAHVVVEALDDRGQLRTGARLNAESGGRPFPLKETAPGRYEASLPLDQGGLQLITVGDQLGHGQASTWAWNPSGTELSQGGADWPGLARLAARTGGKLQAISAPSLPDRTWGWGWVDLRNWWMLVALVLMLAELGWRSTSLGQFALAWTQLREWWSQQSRVIAPKTSAPPPRRTAEEEQRRLMEAYRALARRNQKAAEEDKHHEA